MKKNLLIALIPLAGIAGFSMVTGSTTNLLEVRPDPWPINLQKITDGKNISYALEFRDQGVMNDVVLDTLPFTDLEQLKYFGQGLSALKKGHNGDIANYKDYSIKRTDVKKEPAWYLLRYQNGLTNFQQPEADKMIETIAGQ